MFKKSTKNILILYGSSILGIPLGFLISIFISRTLGPEKFGDYKFIETAARFIASIVSVGLFISIARLVALKTKKTEKQSQIGLFTFILGIISIIGIVLFFLLSYLEPYIFGNGLNSNIRNCFFIVSAIIGNLALLQILKGLEKINSLAILGVLPNLIFLIIGYLVKDIFKIDINLILQLYYGILLLNIIIIIIRLKPKFNFNNELIKELLKENKFNGRPIYYGSLAGVATTHIAGFSISYYLNNTEVGFYMLALTVCSPLLVIPSVIGTTFFTKFVTMRTIPSKVFLFSFFSTLVALIVFYSLIETVVVSFYTIEYLPVAEMSKFLIIGFIFHGFGDLLNRFLGAKGKGKLLRNAAFLVGVVNVLGYTILIKYFGINGAILTSILASCLYMIAMFYYYSNFIKTNK